MTKPTRILALEGEEWDIGVDDPLPTVVLARGLEEPRGYKGERRFYVEIKNPTEDLLAEAIRTLKNKLMALGFEGVRIDLSSEVPEWPTTT